MELVSTHRRLDTATYEGGEPPAGNYSAIFVRCGTVQEDCHILSTKEWAIIMRMTALYRAVAKSVCERSLQESVFKKLCLTDLF